MPRKDGTGPAGETGGSRMGGPAAAGPGGHCVCPTCGFRQPHAAGNPCNKMKCPRCGTRMTGED
jgi:hypothetical protein